MSSKSKTAKAAALAAAGVLAETQGSSVGGAILDNGPKDQAKTEHETPGGSQTAKATANPTDLEIGKISWTDKGREDGKAVKDAESGAYKKVREILLERAEGFMAHGLTVKGDLQEIPQLWLDGYGEAMGRERKSEVRSVFIAACRLATERSTGTYRKGNPEAGEDATKDYVNKETHTGLVWLQGCTSYAQLVKVARDLKGSEGRSTIIKIKTALSNKAFDAVQETVKAANASQAQVIAQGALNKMQMDVNSDRILLSTVLGIMIRLDASTKDPAIKHYSEAVGKETSLLIGRLEKAALEAGVVKAPVATMQAPAVPAQAEAVEVPAQEKAA
jgi:hypothetical protein